MRCPAGKRRAAIVELQAHAIALPRHQRRGRGVAVAMREVQHAEAHAQRFARRMDVAQPDHQVGDRLVAGELERDDGRAQDLHGLVERRRLEQQRADVVGTLVARLIAAAAERAPFAGLAADRLRRAHIARRERRSRRCKPGVRQEQAMRLAVMRRPGGLGHPASGQRLVVRRRLMALGHPGAQHRLVHDARRLALQPMVPPAQHLLQEADCGPGLAKCG